VSATVTDARSGTSGREVSRPVAAVVGLVAVVAALGSGQLAAAIVSPGSSPFFAVADEVIRLSPEWLTEFGKSLGPVWDKLVLQIGVAVAVLAFGVVAGLVGRRVERRGEWVVIALGLVAVAAVFAAPTFAPLDVLAPAVAVVAGAYVFRWLHARAVRAAEEPATTPEGVTRRKVLAGGAAGIGVVSVGAGLGGLALGRGAASSRDQVTAMLQQATITKRAPVIPPGADFAATGTPTFLTKNADFYRIDTALRVPSVSAADWSLRIHGMVDREISMSFADLMSRPLVERVVTMTCVSNPVGGDLISTARFVGVELRDILLEAGVQEGCDQVFSTSVDGWTCGTPTDVLLQPDRGAMLVVGMNGEALPPEHGFPVRMVVPGLYGYVSATKWVTDLEATTFDARQAYWIDRGWGVKGPIKTECRIDLPRGFSTVPAGRTTIAGIAWCQHTGISKVEVQLDGGAWQACELTTEVTSDAWRMWRITLDVAPGSHTVLARATDAKGVVQTDQAADVVPDGATGYPGVIFGVR
jgi:DMSO/TMAO reductase YedYZ molybdopterin-dependent catalytic subunit